MSATHHVRVYLEFPYIEIVMRIYAYMNMFSVNMVIYGCMMMSLTLPFFLHGTSTVVGDNTCFISTTKRLQCHEIKSTSARSKVECSLNCKEDLYSCAGYVYDSSHFRCDVCFIYDKTTPLVTMKTSNSTSSSMPEINMNTGEVNCHDDVIKWKHIPRYWPFERGIHRSPVNSQHKGQWRFLSSAPEINALIMTS